MGQQNSWTRHKATSPLVLFVGTMFLLTACASGGGDDNQPGANPAFNGTFSESMGFTQGGQSTPIAMSVTLTVHSPLNGVFVSEDGRTGTIAGDIEGNGGLITGTIIGTCPGTFRGSLTLLNDNLIAMDTLGSDCNGDFLLQGGLSRPGSTALPDDLDTRTGCFDVAVAVLRGGLWRINGHEIEVDSPLDMIRAQAIRVDPTRVTAVGVPNAPLDGQQTIVRNWLAGLNKGCNKSVKVVLVGHSLGGDAVRRSKFSNMCSRIAIDPIDPDEILNLNEPLPVLNQRTLPPKSLVKVEGRFLNILAFTTDDLDGEKGRGLLGYTIHLNDAIEMIELATNHFTVVSRVLTSGLVSNEVQTCLDAVDDGGGGGGGANDPALIGTWRSLTVNGEPLQPPGVFIQWTFTATTVTTTSDLDCTDVATYRTENGRLIGLEVISQVGTQCDPNPGTNEEVGQYSVSGNRLTMITAPDPELTPPTATYVFGRI